MDDTLISSFEAYANCHRRVAAVLGWPELADAQLVTYGRDFPSTLQRHYPGRDVEVFMDTWRREMVAFPCGAIEGAAATLHTLRALGHRLWIVTSRTRENLSLRMRQGGLDETWFEGVFAQDDQPAPKPDPRCFEPVWKRRQQLNGESHPAIYVGDRQGDGEAAKAAGIHFVAVLTGPEATEGFPGEGHHEHDVLDDVTQLIRWLDVRGLHVLDAHRRAIASNE